MSQFPFVEDETKIPYKPSDLQSTDESNLVHQDMCGHRNYREVKRYERKYNHVGILYMNRFMVIILNDVIS